MHYTKTFGLFCLALFFIFSCKTKNGGEDASLKAPSVRIVSEDLDKALFQCKSAEDVRIFLKKYNLLRAYFSDFQGDTVQLAAHLFTLTQNPDLKTFKSQLDSLIPDRKATITDPLAKAFGRIKFYYPEFRIPKIQFMVTGFTGNDLFISDSLIIIGLDYFGGPAARYRPNVFDYQLNKYEKSYIVPSILFFESNRFNKMNGADKTLLADMIAYGKGFEFVRRVMPEIPDSLIIGYSAENLRRTYNSQQDIWNFLVASKLLYESSDLKKKKITEDRPFTTEIGNQVPGAIGRWVGWRIVELYMKERPDVGLVQMMAMDNAPAILQESGYRGQKDEEE